MYLAAFLSFFSLMMTWFRVASLRLSASTPAIFVTNLRGFLSFFEPLPPHAPCEAVGSAREMEEEEGEQKRTQPGRVLSSSFGASRSISFRFVSAKS